MWTVQAQQPWQRLRTSMGSARHLLAGLLGEASLHALPGRHGQCLAPARESCSSSLCPPLDPVGGVLLPWSAHRLRSSYVSPPSFFICRCSDSTLPLWQALGSSEYTFSCHSSASSGSLHTASPGPLPGSDLWSLRLSTHPSPTITDKNFRLGSAGQRRQTFMHIALYFGFCKPAYCALLLGSKAPLCPSWSP